MSIGAGGKGELGPSQPPWLLLLSLRLWEGWSLPSWPSVTELPPRRAPSSVTARWSSLPVCSSGVQCWDRTVLTFDVNGTYIIGPDAVSWWWGDWQLNGTKCNLPPVFLENPVLSTEPLPPHPHPASPPHTLSDPSDGVLYDVFILSGLRIFLQKDKF